MTATDSHIPANRALRARLAEFFAPLARTEATSPKMRRLQAVADTPEAELAARGLTRTDAIRRAIGPGALLV